MHFNTVELSLEIMEKKPYLYKKNYIQNYVIVRDSQKIPWTTFIKTCYSKAYGNFGENSSFQDIPVFVNV